MRPALFFDRDGTLNEDVGHNADLGRLRLLPGAAEAVRLGREAGFATVLVTNQSGVARGLFAEAEVRAMNEAVSRLCGGLDAAYYCPHHPRQGREPYRRSCDCRKPSPGMLLRAKAELDLDLGRSVLIGDSLRDLEAGIAAGAGAVLVLTGAGTEARPQAQALGLGPERVAASVLEAVRGVLDRDRAAAGARR